MAEAAETPDGVLIVEDHEPTADLMVRALTEAAPTVHPVTASTADEALKILERTDGSGPQIDLVLLDLELPDATGFEVLDVLHADPDLCRTPVIVISGNAGASTVERCYESNARTFIEKPAEWEEFLAVAEAITAYWFETASIPSSHAGDPMEAE